jgi:hypothetical protein
MWFDLLAMGAAQGERRFEMQFAWQLAELHPLLSK